MNGTGTKPRRMVLARGWLARLVGLGALGATLLLGALWGCGDVSLLNVFEEEENALPMDVEPDGRYLPVTWPITLTVSGGVEPYTYAFTPAVGTWDPDDGSVTYIAPGSISEEVEEVTLVVTDFLGKQKTVKLKIHSPLQVDPPVFTREIDQPQDITLGGGVRPYRVEYSGPGSVSQTANPHVFRYTAPSNPGTDSIVFKDATSTALNTLTVKVTVTGFGALAVNPVSAVINPGESITFLVTGGSGGYTITQSPVAPGGGTTAPTTASAGDTITYTAPAVLAVDLAVIVTVDDGSDRVDFDVSVQAPPAAPLSVTYDPPESGKKIKIRPGGTITVTASGGRPPYTFAVPERDGAITVPDPTNQPEVAEYTALKGNTKKVSETIVVSDSATPPAVDSMTVEIQKP